MSMIYKTIEQWQDNIPWGRILDAGTGEQSLTWALSLASESLTAVTGSQDYYKELNQSLNLSDNQQLIVDNWINNSLLSNEIFDTVLVDYLLGAVDGFSPYFQNDLLHRLKRHLSPEGNLYFIGLEPFPDYSENKGDQLLIQLAKLRDACILLAGHRCYREYPMEWVQAELVKNGFENFKTKPFFNQFGMPYVNSQLNVARSKLPFIQNGKLNKEISDHTQTIEKEIETHIQEYGPISFGFDYLIQAKRRKK